MRIAQYTFLTLVLLTSGIACRSMEAGGVFGRFDRTRYTSSMDSCPNDSPADYVMHNSVLSLEVYTENNHAMGFDLVKGFLSLFSVRFSSTSAKLSMRSALTTTKQGMSRNEYSGYEALAVNSEAKEENKKWNFALGLDADWDKNCSPDGNNVVTGGVCLEHIRNTPINDLIYTALENGFRKMIDQVDNKYGDEWRSRIVQKPESHLDHFFIPVGDYANVKVGDVFVIHNIEHSFRGIPCDSEYLGFSKTTRRPLAHVRVVDTNPFSSLVQVISEYSWNLNGRPSHKHIQYGALVEIESLIDEDIRDRRLSRSLELGIIRSLIMPFNTSTNAGTNTGPNAGTGTPPNVGGQTGVTGQAGNTTSNRNALLLNITPLVCENIRTVANQYGFYIYTEDYETEIRRCNAGSDIDQLFWDREDQENTGTLTGLLSNALSNNNSGSGQ